MPIILPDTRFLSSSFKLDTANQMGMYYTIKEQDRGGKDSYITSLVNLNTIAIHLSLVTPYKFKQRDEHFDLWHS